MSLIENQGLIAVTGGVQQKNALAPHERTVSEVSAGLKAGRLRQSSELMLEEHPVPDTASISRSGIVALESAHEVDDETVIRDEDAAGRALTDSTARMAADPKLAVEVQANQTAQQILELVTEPLR